MVIMLIIFILANSFEDYGEYFLWKNFGGSFADYSGNGFHAYNGAEIGEDLNDTIHTDRGAYFSGEGQFVSLHNQVWGSPTIGDDW